MRAKRAETSICLWFTEEMRLTPYHARYFAHELTKRSRSASIDSLTSALADAQVDLNPHQVEAAPSSLPRITARGETDTDMQRARWATCT